MARWLSQITSMLIVFWALASCGNDIPARETTQGLINEGMSKTEVKKILGEPESIDTSGVIYDVESGKKLRIERWYYEKRTAVFMNDTLKSANSR